MVDRNDSFMREVDEDLRRDQFLKLWQDYGTFVMAGLVLVFLAVAAYKWREVRQVTFEEQTGARFETALRLAADGKSEEASKALGEIVSDGSAGYRTLARIRLAGEHAKAGRTAEALAAYEAVSADSAADEIMRDFAALQAAMLRLDQADWTETKNRLTPMLGDSRPWRASARELLGLAAYKAGMIEEATKAYEQLLGDKSATNGQSRRAQEMLAVLTDAAAAKGAPEKAAEPSKSAEPAAKK